MTEWHRSVPHPEALYFHIAQDALRVAQANRGRQDDQGVFTLKEAVTTVYVFSLLCLEAFINQEFQHAFGVGKSSRRKARPTSLIEKWLHLPLYLGEPISFDKATEPYRSFVKLAQLRTRLVHFNPSDERGDYWGNVVGDVAFAEQCFGCLNEMIRHLNRLTNGPRCRPFSMAHGTSRRFRGTRRCLSKLEGPR